MVNIFRMKRQCIYTHLRMSCSLFHWCARRGALISTALPLVYGKLLVLWNANEAFLLPTLVLLKKSFWSTRSWLDISIGQPVHIKCWSWIWYGQWPLNQVQTFQTCSAFLVQMRRWKYVGQKMKVKVKDKSTLIFWVP